MIGRTVDRSREQVRDACLQHSIGGKADSVQEALSLQELIHLRRGKGGIGTFLYQNLHPRSVNLRSIWEIRDQAAQHIKKS